MTDTIKKTETAKKDVKEIPTDNANTKNKVEQASKPKVQKQVKKEETKADVIEKPQVKPNTAKKVRNPKSKIKYL